MANNNPLVENLVILKWASMLNHCRNYDRENERVTRKLEPVKLNFWSLVDHTNPTGESNCFIYFFKSKLANQMIENQMQMMACDGTKCYNEDSTSHYG